MALQQNGVSLSVSDGRFSLLRDGRVGWQDLELGIASNHGAETLADTSVETCNGALVCRGRFPRSSLSEEVELRLQDSGALVVNRKLTNAGASSVTISAAGIGRFEGNGQPRLAARMWTLRMAHMDNLRIERYPWCRPEAPYIRTVPTAPTWFGDQENQALPMLLLTDDTYQAVLVEGQLTQDLTRVRWQLQAAPSGELFAAYQLSWQFVGNGLLLQPGEVLELEPVYYEICLKTHPQDAAAGYYAEVAARTDFRCGDRNILSSRAFYCSWNYGIMQDFTAASLLKTAAFIGEALPNVDFFLIDGGWQGQQAVAAPDCSNFYLGEDNWVDKTRIPAGMPALVQGIRDCGLRPALWWTPSVNLSSALAQDHPDWLARDRDGGPYRIARSGYLDVSLPQVQDYLRQVWEIICNRWGFEAIKMDFWCQAFESDRIRYRHGTTMQWRDWLLQSLRSYLPDDGFLMTCVAVAQGNVHLGKHAESYRCCIDIGHFNHWQEHPLACCWIQPLLAIPGRQTCLLNADGFGVNPKRSDDENLHRLTYGFITMGSLEVDGRIEELAPRHVDWLRRLTTHIDRGYPVRCPDDDAFTGKPFPKVLYVDYPADSPTAQRGISKHVALFNWTDEPRYVGATAAQLGLTGPASGRCFWTDAPITIAADGLCELLPARAARLYELS